MFGDGDWDDWHDRRIFWIPDLEDQPLLPNDAAAPMEPNDGAAPTKPPSILPALYESDDRLLENYWDVRPILVQHFGEKLRLRELFVFMDSVCGRPRAAHDNLPDVFHPAPIPGVHTTRDERRTKDGAVGWFSRHWAKLEPLVAQIPAPEAEQSLRECELRSKNWATACAIEKLFASLPSTTPGKSGKPLLIALRKLARKLAAKNHLTLGLAQKRNEKLLIAWYAENWTLLEDDVKTSELLIPGPAQAAPMPNPPVAPVPRMNAPVRMPEGAAAAVRAPIVPIPMLDVVRAPNQPVPGQGVPPTDPLMDNADGWDAWGSLVQAFDWVGPSDSDFFNTNS
jgi:hypothetical protein